MRKSAADKILEAREKRAELIDEMIKEYKKPLLVMRVNYPGINKNNELTIGIMEDMDKVICDTLGSKSYKKTITSGVEGPILYMAVSEDVIILKQIAIELEENHILGRCLDIDIYDTEGKSISRKQLGYEVRKCYICNDYAQTCVRAKVHSEEEVIAFIKKRYKEYIEFKKENCTEYSINIASLALQAMLYEVSCFPSPGLVSTKSCGAHKDMDYFTFIDSATSLIKPLIYCTEAGFSTDSPSEIFDRIRHIGKLGEYEMLQKTSGINAHKGMLFLLGICSAAAGKAIYSGLGFSSLQSIIIEMAEGLVDRELSGKQKEFQKTDKKALSHGEKLYLEHGIEGIRGEVQRGLPTVFQYSLEFYKSNATLSKNDRLVQTLLGIMQHSEDSNILHRHSIEILKEVQEKSKHIISIGGMKTPEGIKAVNKMDVDFCKRNISPGGSADLLGVTVFLFLLEESFKTINNK